MVKALATLPSTAKVTLSPKSLDDLALWERRPQKRPELQQLRAFFHVPSDPSVMRPARAAQPQLMKAAGTGASPMA